MIWIIVVTLNIMIDIEWVLEWVYSFLKTYYSNTN